jgi:iron(III) transport system substrate-binding protein
MPGKMMRRHAAAGLAALGGAALLWPRPGRAADTAGADAAALQQAARQEGSVTWYVAQGDTPTAERMGRTFTATYPGITVDVMRTTGQVAFQRLLLDIKNQTPHCDVFSATDAAHMPILKERNELTHYVPPNAADMVSRFKAQSDDGWYYVTDAGRWVPIYNRDKVKPADAPKAWTDLLDPKWQGRVSVGHPAFSGGMGAWMLGVVQLHGWQYFEQLARNNPRIGRSTQDTVTLLSAGECLVGPTWAPGAYRAVDKGEPIGIEQASDGGVVMVFPSAIPARAPHPNAARLFLNWMLSAAYSNLEAADGSEPIHAGVPPRADEPALAGLKVVAPTAAELRQGVPELIEKWRDTFGN